MPATIDKKNEEILFFKDKHSNANNNYAEEKIRLENKKANLAFVSYIFTALLLFTFLIFHTYINSNNKKNNNTEISSASTNKNVNISEIPPLSEIPISLPEITSFVPDVPTINNENFQRDYEKIRALKAEIEFQKYHTEMLKQEANQKMILSNLHTINLDNLQKEELLKEAEQKIQNNSYESKNRILDLND